MLLAPRFVRHFRLTPSTCAALMWLLGLGAVAVSAQGCAGAPKTWDESSRYPEKKRPEPARSASDGEILGAHKQDPADTLEASPTNEHPAVGWGDTEPHGGSTDTERSDAERNVEACLEQARQAKSGTRPAEPATGQKPKLLCPPAPGE